MCRLEESLHRTLIGRSAGCFETSDHPMNKFIVLFAKFIGKVNLMVNLYSKFPISIVVAIVNIMHAPGKIKLFAFINLF